MKTISTHSRRGQARGVLVLGVAVAALLVGVSLGRFVFPGSSPSDPSNGASRSEEIESTLGRESHEGARIPVESTPASQTGGVEEIVGGVTEALDPNPVDSGSLLSAEEIMALSPEERYDLVYERRPSYIAGAKASIRRSLERFDQALGDGDRETAFIEGENVMMMSVIMMLAEEERGEYADSGKSYNLGGDGSFDRVMWNHWVFEFQRGEFPEYFDLAEVDAQKVLNPETRRFDWPEYPAYLVGKTYEYAENAFSCFPDIEPLGD